MAEPSLSKPSADSKVWKLHLIPYARESPGRHVSILNYEALNKLQVGPAGLSRGIIGNQAGPSQVAQLLSNEIQLYLKAIQFI